MPELVKGKSAMRIARLEALVTAMQDALRESNELLLQLLMVAPEKEQRDRIWAQRDENCELNGVAHFYMGEGRSL